jgi:cytochrome P450 / NADPH-cytochrome P450 reductase
MDTTPDTALGSSAMQIPVDPTIPVADLSAASAAATSSPRPLTLTETLEAFARRYGPIFQMSGAGARTLVLSGSALIDEVCDDQRFDKKIRGGLGEMRGVLGDGLFTADTADPNWGKAHRILMPAFSMQAMKDYMPQMLDLADQLVLKWQRLNPDDEIDAPADMTRLTLDTIGLCGFGYRFNSFYREDQHPFVQAMVDALERAQRRGYSGAVAAETGEDAAREQRDYQIMNALVDQVIQRRKAGGQEAVAANHDLLSAMLTGVDRQTGERLDDTNIRYQIITFMIAGHETTSGALSFTLYFLLKHPDILARAYGEVDQVLGADLSVQPSYEQVRHLTYLSQIFKEALRLWPTAPGFSRYAYQPTTLGGQYAIAPADGMFAITPLLHRDPALWGDDAEAFNPDHFSPEAEQARPVNAYKPFGTGQRACIGRQFAMQEAALALGMILQRFELIDHTDYQLQIKQTLTIKPDHFMIKVRPRTHRNVVAPTPETNGHRQAVATAAPAAAPAAASTLSPAQHNTPVLVLYGSNLGTAEDLAHRIGDGGTAHGFATTVAPLDDYTGRLPAQGAVVVVTSSYNGTPPDNAVKFCDWLRSGSIAADQLKGVRYTVFGCGDRDWTATFQAIPRLVDAQLEVHGAQRIHLRGEGDARGDFDGQFQSWYAGLWTALSAALAIEAGAVEAAAVQAPLYTLEYVTAPETNPYATASGAQPLPILVNRELTAVDGQQNGRSRPATRSTRHLEVALREGMSYRTGDHLAVIPHNSMELIERVLVRFGVGRDAFVTIHRNSPGTTQLPLDQPVSVLGLLARYVELQDVATRGQIKRMADFDECPPEREQLLALADDPRYTDEVLAKRLTLIDLLEAYPACALPPNVFLEWLRPLRPRYYSISSSPLADARTCAITVAVVDAPARSGHGTFNGTCSSYLKRQPARNAVYAFTRSPQMAFRPPDNPAIPIIMVGPGTGFAPFRGFLQERAALKQQGARLGRSLLFFGCRTPDEFIYQDELRAWSDQGITEVSTAFSRVEGQPKTYVQDQIRAHADDVWQLIQDGAVIYICGDAGRMEPDVRKAFTDIYQAKTGAGEQQAADWLDQMTRANRYLADVWAGG